MSGSIKTEPTSEKHTQPLQNSWAVLSPHVFVKTAIIAALLWLVFRNEISRTLKLWVTDSSWSHGFLIPLFSLYFLNQKRAELIALKPSPNYLGLVSLILCLAFYIINTVHFKVSYLNSLVIIASFGSVALLLGGWKLIKYTWLPIIYLVFAAPLPGGIYRMITIPMRKIAASAATWCLNVIPEVQATSRGVIVDVIYKGVKVDPLDVAEACSGMRLLMAFLALGVAMAYLHYRPAWQRLVLLASTIPIAILCNVVRVTVTGFIIIFGNPIYARGIWHDLLGMLMLPLAFCFYGLLAWFMSNLFVEEQGKIEEDVIVRKKD